jgi:PAS domain S-box-containing protein
MRRLAEQRSDRIIESSPNGIVILDEKFSIMHINPSFKKMFSCGMSVVGKHISYLVDPQPFEELASGKERIIETTVKHENYNLICHQKLYKLEEEKQYVGIFVDVTKNIADKEKLDSLKSETIEQAQELLDHQISMAQNLVKFLGESTAKGENLVENLLKLTEKEDANPQQRKGKWLWDMYTSK